MKKKRGVNGTRVGEAHHASKMTELQVKELRRMVADGICIGCAQKLLKLNCSYASAWDAANYTTWRHVN